MDYALGDTKIRMMDGNSQSFLDLSVKNLSKIYVISYDITAKETVPAVGKQIVTVGNTHKLVRTVLGDGSCVLSTLDRLFLLSNGTYKEACRLKDTDILITVDCENSEISHILDTEIINTPYPVEVYDIWVPGYHNFAIGNGVFVHNC